MQSAYTTDDAASLKAFGVTVRRLRKMLGKSQEELAHLAGLDRSYIGGVERGERNVSLININCIAKALNTSREDLFKQVETYEKGDTKET